MRAGVTDSLAKRVTYICGAASIIFDPEVRGYCADFEFWQRVIKERQENVIHSNLWGVSRQRR